MGVKTALSTWKFKISIVHKKTHTCSSKRLQFLYKKEHSYKYFIKMLRLKSVFQKKKTDPKKIDQEKGSHKLKYTSSISAYSQKTSIVKKDPKKSQKRGRFSLYSLD